MSIRSEKEAVVSEVREKLDKAKSVVLTDYRGLNVAEVTLLRKKLREAKVEYRVIKNTMTRFAAKDLGLEAMDPYLEGPTALAFSYEDPAAAPKILTEFAKTSKKLTIKGGMIEGKVIDEIGVQTLADLPPREVLLSMVLAGIQTPIVNWVSVLNAPIRGFIYALDGVRKQKEA